MFAPIPATEAARLTALRAYGILDTPPEAAFERIASLAARILEMPDAFISFVDQDRQWRKAILGSQARETPREASFCAHAILGDAVMVVPDATADPRFADNPMVTGEQGVRFYAGAPLRDPDGHRLGALCVTDTRPHRFDERQQAILSDLAALVVDELALRREVAARQQIYEGIEQQVTLRTAELTQTNRALQTEIQQRQFADQARERSEQRFRQLFNQASDVAMVHDLDGRLVDVNEQACASLGYTRAELLTMGVPDFEMMHDPVEAFRCWRELAIGSVEQFEGCHRRKDGSTFPVEIHVSVLDTTEGRYLLALVRDITARKHAEELLRVRAREQEAVARLGTRALSGGGVDELLREAVTLIGEALGIERCRVHEHLPERGLFVVRASLDPAGADIGEVVTDDDTSSPSGYVLHTGQAVIIDDVETERRFKIPDSLRKYGAKSVLCVLIGGQNPGDPRFGVLGASTRQRRVFTRDDQFFLQSMANVLAAAIARHRHEIALRAARDESEKANHAKSVFLSRMSHELRTPLNAILGFGQLLELSPLGQQEILSLSYIMKGGRHLLTLIDEVLDLSRAETGHLHLAPGHVNVGVLVHECVGLVTRLAQPRGIICRVDVPDGLSLWADEQRLRQVLLNLLSNAVKYNHEGGTVVVTSEETPPGRLRIKVSDTGPGIPPEGIARLFVPFERLEQEFSEAEGTGLGLVISRRIAEAMGGSLDMESEPGRGSTFWIELPLATPPPVAATALASTPAEPRLPTPVPRARLLYIEDNLSNLLVVKAMLANCRPHWEFLSARDGHEGLAQAERCLPDLILLDLQLPGINGDAVLVELRSNPLTRNIPVILLSADATPHSRERLLAGGAVDYISKPFKLEDLLDRLDRTLQNHREPAEASK